ncbi:MAG: Crp/Fnr family transcriptional regulator [Rhodobacteraceae bacterium]|nr:Crp/Fnr family transcriptional regulator [Paracoccaceae bacterium]
MLPKTGFLANASPQLINALEALSDRVELEKGEVLFEQEDEGDALYAIEAGRVEISVLSEDGRKLVLDVMGAGSVLGEIALFDPGPRTASVSALEPTILRRVRNDDLLTEIRVRPEIGIDMIHLAGARMRWMSGQVGDQVFLPMSARLARRLLYLTAAQHPASNTVSMSQTQLADFVGSSREAVSKTLADWKRNGVVSVSRNGVEILDRLTLLSLAEQSF